MLEEFLQSSNPPTPYFSGTPGISFAFNHIFSADLVRWIVPEQISLFDVQNPPINYMDVLTKLNSIKANHSREWGAKPLIPPL
jgi:hypothetical protein